jgi:hypothetical protein
MNQTETPQKEKKQKYSVYELLRIESALRELSMREKLDAETAWDLLQNIQAIEPMSKNFQEFQKQMFQKYSVTQNGQTGIDPSKFHEYEKELNLVGDKEVELKLAVIPLTALLDKEAKVHTDILLSISKIVKKS